MPKPYYTLQFQFRLAEQALSEARNLQRAKYYTKCISECYQVAHRYAAGLLFGIEAKVHTERDVGIGFEAAFVSTGRTPSELGKGYRRLFELRQKADFDYEYLATPDEAVEALSLAERFHDESARLRQLIESGPANPHPSGARLEDA